MLCLKMMDFSDRWISSSCKGIKDVSLLNVSGIKDITIESSSLERFGYVFLFDNYDLFDLNISGEKLEYICIHWQFDSMGDSSCGLIHHIRSLNIRAPKLKRIVWGGKHQHLGNLICLEEAKIYLFPDLEDFKSPFETLNLNEETTKAFFVEGSKPLPLCNIRNLTLEVRNLEDDFVPAMVYIFRGITTLNTLCMKSDIYKPETEEEDNVDTTEEDDATEEEDNESVGENSENKEADNETDATEEENNYAPKFDVEYWKSQNLTFTNELQEVTMEVVEGNDNELELARYILEHARELIEEDGDSSFTAGSACCRDGQRRQ